VILCGAVRCCLLRRPKFLARACVRHAATDASFPFCYNRFSTVICRIQGSQELWTIEVTRFVGRCRAFAAVVVAIWPVLCGERFSGLSRSTDAHSSNRSIYGVIPSPQLSWLAYQLRWMEHGFSFGSWCALTVLLIPPLLARIDAEETAVFRSLEMITHIPLSHIAPDSRDLLADSHGRGGAVSTS